LFPLWVLCDAEMLATNEDPSSEESEVSHPYRWIRRKTLWWLACYLIQPEHPRKTVREVDQRRIPPLEKMSAVDEDPMSNVV